MVSLSLKAAPKPSVLIFSIQYINSARIQTQSSLHQPFPWLPCTLVDTDGCCVSTWHQVHVQFTCGILGSPHILALQPGVCVCGCTYAFHWGTWQGCIGQRRRLKWGPKCGDEDWCPCGLMGPMARVVCRWSLLPLFPLSTTSSSLCPPL